MRPIICFGDSITQQGFQAGGWLSLLAAAGETRFDVLNRGFSGQNTEAGLSYGYKIAFEGSNYEPHAVVICYGANDAALLPPQHVPVNRYESNLERIVERLQGQYPSARLILCSPPPVHNEKYRIHCSERNPPDQSRFLDVTRTYRDAAERVANREHVAFVDMFLAFKDASNGELFSDGLHLTVSGNECFYKAVANVLKPHSFPEAFTHWSKLQ